MSDPSSDLLIIGDAASRHQDGPNRMWRTHQIGVNAARPILAPPSRSGRVWPKCGCFSKLSIAAAWGGGIGASDARAREPGSLRKRLGSTRTIAHSNNCMSGALAPVFYTPPRSEEPQNGRYRSYLQDRGKGLAHAKDAARGRAPPITPAWP